MKANKIFFIIVEYSYYLKGVVLGMVCVEKF